MNSKNQKGITLVALVITIIVMLILAGVAISSAINSDGLFEKANEARFKTDMATLKEEISFKKLMLQSEGKYTIENLSNAIKDSNVLKEYDYQLNGDLLIIEDEVISITGGQVEKAVASDWHYQIVNNEEAWIYGYKGTETDITIPSFIEENGIIYPVTMLSQSWTAENFQEDTSITSVKILSNIKEIEPWVFNGCTALTSVTMADSVTILGDGVFNNCPVLKEVKLSNNITEFGNSMFAFSPKLESCNLPSKITSIPESTFNSCSSIKTITVPDSVTSIGDTAFAQCTSLTKVVLSNNITEMGINIFLECISLESCNIPNKLTTIPEGLFNQCRSLKSITIPSTVTTIGKNAFVWCTSLEVIDVPATVKDIGDSAFAYVGNNGDTYMGAEWGGSLKKIILREGLETIGNEAFINAQTVTENLQKPSTVTSVGTNAFQHFGTAGGGQLVGW